MFARDLAHWTAKTWRLALLPVASVFQDISGKIRLAIARKVNHKLCNLEFKYQKGMI
jgi:hypothetical protein